VSAAKDLILDVYYGRTAIEDLTEEEYNIVIDGFRQVAEELVKMAETGEIGNAILVAIAEAEADPFEAAITAAEARGNTYWELEVDYIH
jgi:hypothetical protein